MAVRETVSCIKEAKQRAFLTEPEKRAFVTADACHRLPSLEKYAPLLEKAKLCLQL